MVAFLMENMSPEDINHPGFGGCTAIHVAVLMGHLPVVSILASKGASLIVSIIHYPAAKQYMYNEITRV